MSKVSIITPFYNGSQYIQKCIESIQAQSFKDFEHIIVDDGSIEPEREFVIDFIKKFSNVILISQKNSGQAAAVNAGIKIAKGEYVAFCDQDDWWLPEKLQKQIAYLESRPDIAMVYGDVFLGDEKGSVLSKTWMQSRRVDYVGGNYEECVAKLFNRNFIPAPVVVLIRKNVFDKIGLFDKKFSSVYDYDFWFRMLEAGYKIGYIEKPLAVWRTYPEQESHKIKKIKKMLMVIIFDFLERKPEFILQHPVKSIFKLIKVSGAYFTNYDPYNNAR
jgi:glycosyltransferase involved in cell wall biosynthesis